MSELPSFQFYPSDWRKDAAVLSMNRFDRSVWLDLVCIMHDSPERGVLLLPNGRPMNEAQIANNVGLSISQTRKAITAIMDSGTGSRRDSDGAIFNRRMVRDERIRQIRKECGRLGGNPDLVKHKANQNPTTAHKQKSTPSPSSSPSSSSSNSEGTKEKGISPAAEKRAGRKPDPAYELFRLSYRLQYPLEYIPKPADWVELAKLRKAMKIGTQDVPEYFGQAVENYLASPRKHTIAGLCSDYNTFAVSPLNEFNRPINHQGVNANGRQETNIAAAQRVLARFDSEDSGGS